MKRAIQYFFHLVYLLALALLYGVGLIVIAFSVCLLIGICFPDPSSIIGRIFVIGFISILALVLLAVIDGIKKSVAVRRYLRALPKVDAQSFRQAFPEYEENSLFEVRQIIATRLRIDPDKVSSELYFGRGSALCYRMSSLYVSLFKRFRPASVPEIEMVTVRTAGIRPRPAHIVDFPAEEVSSLGDLLREIDRLRHLEISPLGQARESVSPQSESAAAGSLTKTFDQFSAEERAYLEGHRLTNPIAKWISTKLFSYDETPLKTDLAEGVAEVCDVIVGRVAIGVEHNDEGPIFLLDVGNGEILVLIGQWMCKPQFMKVQERLLDQWDSETSFFKRFCLRRAPGTGAVLSLTVKDGELIRAERSIPHEAIAYPFGESCFMRGSFDTLEADLMTLSGDWAARTRES